METMDKLQQDNNQFQSLDEKKKDDTITKRKGRWVLYLPALFTALITIALLLIIIIGSIFSGATTNNSQTRLLHQINFISENAQFNENYIYLPYASESPEVIINQGFRWEVLQSKIQINVPEYENGLSLEINYGGFNAKTYDSAPAAETPQYEILSYDQSDQLLETKNFNNVSTNDEATVEIVAEDIAYVEIAFQRPAMIITTGYLYVKNIALSEIII